MVKFLFVGDLHLRGTNPRNRIDDYKEVAKQKLKEVFKIAVDNAVDAILQPGDIFDRPEVGIAVLLEFAEVLKESPVNIYCTLGNHDIYGYNVDSYYRTSLRLYYFRAVFFFGCYLVDNLVNIHKNLITGVTLDKCAKVVHSVLSFLFFLNTTTI